MKRALEILPGALSWGTLALLLVLSWKLPLAVALFIVIYDLYWLLRTVYFFIHLRASFVLMRKNERTNWRETLETSGMKWDEVRHAAVFTIYKEPYEVVRESVENLTRANFPLKRIYLVLALEARGGAGDRVNAEKIIAEFGDMFARARITVHPGDIEGEVAGKASNEAWSVRRFYEDVVKDSGTRTEDVLVTVFDADVHAGKEFFGILTHAFLSNPDRLHSGYQPVAVFSNAYTVPLFARLLGFSCTFWTLIQQARAEKLITFSCYSLPLTALVDVGFWSTDVIAEDARIFYQCLDRYAGNWRVTPLNYPVAMEAVSGGSLWEAAKNLYKQQRRWAWGAENIPFVVTKLFANKKFSLRERWYWTYDIIATFHMWAVSSLAIFFAGFLPNLLGGAEFRTSVASYNLPMLTSLLMNLSMFGVVTSAFLSILLLSPKEAFPHARWYHYLSYALQWIFVPVALIAFGALPALDAQTRLMFGGRFRLGYWNTPRASKAKSK